MLLEENVLFLFVLFNSLVFPIVGIGKLHFLEKLNVDNNHLKKLPATVGNLHSLVSLNVANNELVHLPKGNNSNYHYVKKTIVDFDTARLHQNCKLIT